MRLNMSITASNKATSWGVETITAPVTLTFWLNVICTSPGSGVNRLTAHPVGPTVPDPAFAVAHPANVRPPYSMPHQASSV